MVITENPPPEVRNDIRAQYHALAEDAGAEVSFIEDGHLARQYVLERRTDDELPIVFGSTWENALAQQLNAPLVEIGYPCTDEVVLSRAYVGYRGALALIERAYTTVVRPNTLV